MYFDANMPPAATFDICPSEVVKNISSEKESPVSSEGDSVPTLSPATTTCHNCTSKRDHHHHHAKHQPSPRQAFERAYRVG